MLGPWGHIRKRGLGTGGWGFLAKEPVLAREALLLPHLGLAEGVVQRGHELRALAPERITRAGVDQRLDHPLVAQPQIDPVAQLDQRAIRTRLPSRDDRG